MANYSTEEVQTKLADYDGWELTGDGQLSKNFTLGNFKEAFMFVSAVAYLAEAHNHHPDILMHGWKHVRLTMMSHDVGAITNRDFKLLAAVEGLPTF